MIAQVRCLILARGLKKNCDKFRKEQGFEKNRIENETNHCRMICSEYYPCDMLLELSFEELAYEYSLDISYLFCEFDDQLCEYDEDYNLDNFLEANGLSLHGSVHGFGKIGAVDDLKILNDFLVSERTVDSQPKEAECISKNNPKKQGRQSGRDINEFFFGNYIKGNRESSTPMSWIVLDEVEGKMLVVSKYVIGNRNFHESGKTTPWCDSLIRAWLNTEFINTVFNDQEREKILPTTIQEPGSDGVSYTTTDSVFLLSENETKKYFPTADSRRAMGAEGTGDFFSDPYNSDAVYWGLRSYKKGADSFQYCTPGGRVMSNSFDGFFHNVNCTMGVRPAMWITV